MAEIYHANGVDIDDTYDPETHHQQQLFDWETNLTQIDLSSFIAEREQIEADLQSRNPLKNQLISISPEAIGGIDMSHYSTHPVFLGNESLPEDDIDPPDLEPHLSPSPQPPSQRLTDDQFNSLLNDFLSMESSSFLKPPQQSDATTPLTQPATTPLEDSTSIDKTNAMAKFDVLKRATNPYSVFDSHDDPLAALPTDDPVVVQHKLITQKLVLDTRSHWAELKRIQIQKENEPLDEENLFYRNVNAKNNRKEPSLDAQLQRYDQLTRHDQPLVIGGKYKLLSQSELNELSIEDRVEYEKLRRKYLHDKLCDKYSAPGDTKADKELQDQLDALPQDDLDQLFDQFSFDDNQLVYLNTIKRMLRVNFNKIFQSGIDTTKHDLSKPLMAHIQYDLYLWISEKLQQYRQGLVSQQRLLNGMLFDIRHGLLVVDSYGTVAQLQEQQRMALPIDDDPELAAEYQRLREQQELKLAEMRQRKRQSIAARSGQHAELSADEKEQYDQKELIFKLLASGKDIDSILSNHQYSTVMGDELSSTLPKEAIMEFAKTHLRLMQRNKDAYRPEHMTDAMRSQLDSLPLGDVDSDGDNATDLLEEYSMNIHPGQNCLSSAPQGAKLKLKQSTSTSTPKSTPIQTTVQKMDDIDTDHGSSESNQDTATSEDSDLSFSEDDSDSSDEFAFQRSRYTGASKAPRSGLIPRNFARGDKKGTSTMTDEEKAIKLQQYQDRLDARAQEEFYEDLKPLLKPYENYSKLPEHEIISRRDAFLDEESSNFKPTLQQLLFALHNDHEVETFFSMLEADMFDDHDWTLRPWVRKKYDPTYDGDEDALQPMSYGGDNDDDDADKGEAVSQSDQAEPTCEEQARTLWFDPKSAIMPLPRIDPTFVDKGAHLDPEEQEMEALYTKHRDQRREIESLTKVSNDIIAVTQELFPSFLLPPGSQPTSPFNPAFDNLDAVFESCVDSLFSKPLQTHDEWFASLPLDSRLPFLPAPPMTLTAEELKPSLAHAEQQLKNNPFYQLTLHQDRNGVVDDPFGLRQKPLVVDDDDDETGIEDAELIDETDPNVVQTLVPGIHKTKSSTFVLKLESKVVENEHGEVSTDFMMPNFEQVFDSLVEKVYQEKQSQHLQHVTTNFHDTTHRERFSGINDELVTKSEAILQSVLTKEEQASFIAASKAQKAVEHNDLIKKSRALEEAFKHDPTNTDIQSLTAVASMLQPTPTSASTSTSTSTQDAISKVRAQFSRDNLTKLTSSMSDDFESEHLNTSSSASLSTPLHRGPEYTPTQPAFYAEFTTAEEACSAPLPVEVNEEFQQGYKEAYENNLLSKSYLDSTLFPEPIDYHIQMDLLEQNGLTTAFEESRQQLISKFAAVFRHNNPAFDGKFAPLKANGDPMSLREEFEYKLALDIKYRRQHGRDPISAEQLSEIIHKLDLSDEEVGVLIGNQLNNTSNALTARVYAQQTVKAEALIHDYRKLRDPSFPEPQSTSFHIQPEMAE